MKVEKQGNQQMELSNGANFFRCALQVNPHHYSNTYRGKKGTTPDESTYVQAVLAKAREHHIDVLAITDHNHVGSVQVFGEAAADRIA